MSISTSKQLMLYYKLSKSIEANSDIVTMLKKSMSAYQKELNCYTCAIIRLLKQADNNFIAEINFSLPYSLGILGQYEFIQKNIPEKFTEKELEVFLETLPLIRRQENLILHITSLPAFGFLVLITSNEEIARETLDVVTEINEKLAQSCQACFHIQDIEDNESIYRKLIDQLPQVIFETDLAGNITFANHYANQTIDITNDEAEGKVNALEIFPDEEFNRAFRNFKNTLLGIEQAPAEFRIKKRTGDIFPCVVYTSSIIKNLKVTGIRVVLIDISERVKNEKIQNEYTERLELALLGNGSGFWDWDLQTGQLYMSERFRAIIGLEKDENIVDFKSLMSIINEEDKHEINRALTDHLSGRSPYFIAEYRLKAHDNTWKWIFNTAKVVDFDKSGAPLRVAGTVLDITRQKEDEAEILKLRKGIEQSPAMVVITDSEGRFEYINPKFTEVTGYSFEEVKGKKPSILKSGKNSNEYYKNLWDTIVSGEIWQGELINRKKNGELYWEFQSIAPVKNSKNEITNFLSIKEDITERKKLTSELIKAKEEADQASKAKGDFLATMSHEIRTPMNGVIGTTSLLLRTPLSEEQLDYVNTIRNSGDALLTIINDILDYSKIESGKMQFESQPFDLRLCIDEVLELFSAAANQKGLTLLTSIDQRINTQFLGDITRIRQVLVNLVGNAIKFTSAGFVEIIVKKDETTAGIISLLITVRDTGIGIPADKLSGLFQPFTQADTSTSRKFGGSGLGLAITARLVELMGGTISATSELNKGSEFTFELKLVSANIPDIFSAENELAGRKIFFNLADDLLKRTLEAYCKLLRIEIADNINECDFSITKNISSQTGLQVIVISKNPKEPVNIGETTIPVKVQAFITILKKTQSEKNSNHQTFINEENLVLQYPLSLLVAEDNSINQKIMNKSLKSYGYSADFAANGLEVLEALKRQPYDIIFMDIQMPEMDGFEATHQIRQSETQHRPVIIAMTANAMQEDRQKCANAGMDDYVSKPLKVEQVGDMIRKWGKMLAVQKNR